MVHTTLNSVLQSGIRSHRHINKDLYMVVVNGEEGEFYQYEIEAESYAQASEIAESLAADNMVNIQFIEAYKMA